MKSKPTIGLLLGLGKPKSSDEDSEESASLAAARALVKAIKSGDAEAVNDALTAHYDACSMGSESDED